jgi:hypothetical protein
LTAPVPGFGFVRGSSRGESTLLRREEAALEPNWESGERRPEDESLDGEMGRRAMCGYTPYEYADVEVGEEARPYEDMCAGAEKEDIMTASQRSGGQLGMSDHWGEDMLEHCWCSLIQYALPSSTLPRRE